MISPNNSSVDYGSLLQAPAGYAVDFAIATTYSLDLQALIGAHLSLGLNVDTDSSLAKDDMYAFAALSEMKGKLLVFCEKGRIFGAGDYSRLYCMIESSIVEVNLKSAGFKYPSFHPKTWIIRFTPNGRSGPARYRVCILSRNLTFDSSWDLAGSFEGDYREEHRAASPGGNDLKAYVESLARLYGSGAYKKKLDLVKAEIPYVNFASGARNYELALPFSFTGVEHARTFEWEFSKALEQSSRTLVMSPFISPGSEADDPLSRIARKHGGQPGKPILVTRRTSIAQDEKLKSKLQAFQVFAIRDDLVTAEFENEAPGDGEDQPETELPMDSRDIHAKLYLFESSDDRCDLFFGSANASIRGLRANREAMAHLVIARPNAFDTILKELGLTDKEIEKGSLFERVHPESMETTTDEAEAARQKQSLAFDRFLRDINLTMGIEQADKESDAYTVTVTMKAKSDVAENCRVSLASEKTEIQAMPTMAFNGVKHQNLTEFVRVAYSGDGFTVRRLVKCRVTKGAQHLEGRDVKLFQQVTKNRFAEYLAFRLSDNPELSATMGKASNMGVRTTPGKSATPIGAEGLYEDLLRAYASKPEQADAFVKQSLGMLEADGKSFAEEDTSNLIALLQTVMKGAQNA